MYHLHVCLHVCVCGGERVGCGARKQAAQAQASRSSDARPPVGSWWVAAWRRGAAAHGGRTGVVRRFASRELDRASLQSQSHHALYSHLLVISKGRWLHSTTCYISYNTTPSSSLLMSTPTTSYSLRVCEHGARTCVLCTRHTNVGSEKRRAVLKEV